MEEDLISINQDLSSLLFLANAFPPGKTTRFIPQKYPTEYNKLIKLTSFLPEDVLISRRLWHIRNNLLTIPKCECGIFVLWNKAKFKYSLWCSIVCKNKSSIYKTKVKNTCKQKYGTESYTASTDFREKYVNTMNQKYGVDHYLKNKIKKLETQKLLKDKYGYISNFCTNESKQKTKNTFNLKYGCHPTQRRFSYNTLLLLKNKEWLADQHVNQKKTLKEISISLEGYDLSSLSDIFYKFNIPIIHQETSAQENSLRYFLTSLNINILTNSRSIITPYELDIFIPSHDLAIEYCGVYWHNEINKNKNYHKMKYDLCKEKGIRLITIFEDEWIQKQELIKNKLKQILYVSSDEKIFARKCIIKEIDIKQKESFLDENHIQGNGPSSINLGLYYNNELVACLGFIKEKNKVYNLSRYATSKSVVGGFTKLLSYFEKMYNPSQIYTFADLRWSEGDLYYKSGFVLDKILSPDYMYVISDKRYHKFNFRHRRLKKILENYDPSLSEHENCLNHGIYRIYDCGKLRFVKKYQNE